MKQLRIVLLALMSLCSSGVIYAVEVVKEFSAEAIQQAPGRPLFQAQMYVTKEAVRTDSKINKTDVIEISFPEKLTQVLLIPHDKIYMERKSDKAPSIAGPSKSADKNPCAGQAHIQCKLLGKETINGRPTEKWEFMSNRNGQSYRSLHWIDVERHMPIREFFPDGTVSELKIIGNETMNGRNTEKWSLQVTRADGQSMQSTQWYDPELQIAIREELPGGYIRELRNIRTGKQKKDLFAIPKDFRKVEQLPAYLAQPQITPR